MSSAYNFYKGLYDKLECPCEVKQSATSGIGDKVVSGWYNTRTETIWFGLRTNPATLFSGDYQFPDEGLEGIEKIIHAMSTLGHELIHWKQCVWYDKQDIPDFPQCPAPRTNPVYWEEVPLEFQAHSWSAWFLVEPKKAWDYILEITR